MQDRGVRLHVNSSLFPLPAPGSVWEEQAFQRALHVFPVLPQQRQQGHAHAGQRQVEAAAQQRRGELGRRGHAHQDDGDDGQHDVDALAQQHSGVSVFQLHRLLLLLLLQLQLRHAGLTRLQHLLQGKHTAGSKVREEPGSRGSHRLEMN